MQEQATSSGKAEARADLAQLAAGGAARAAEAVSELKGQLAELEAENERLRRMVHELEAENLQRRQKRSRPELLRGATRRLETPLGTLYVTITEDDRGQPFEVFMSLGKAGGALMADVEALGRLISLALRSGIPMKEIYRQLRGISSDRVIGLGPEQDPVGARRGGHRDRALDAGEAGDPAGAAAWCARRAMEPAPVVAQRVRHRGGGEQMMFGGMQETLSGACPDCGSQLEFAEGCMKCHVCGFSECG